MPKHEIFPEAIVLGEKDKKKISSTLSKIIKVISQLDQNSPHEIMLTRDGIDYLIKFLKDFYYSPNNNQINLNFFDKFLSKLNTDDKDHAYLHVIKAHYFNHCFRQTDNESYLWLSFCNLQYCKHIINNVVITDDLTKDLYNYLQLWFTKKKTMSRTKLNENILFQNINNRKFDSVLPIKANYLTFLSLPSDIYIIIMSILPLRDLIALCKTNKFFYKLFHNMHLWEHIEVSRMMTDEKYFKHCEANPEFYRYHARQRIRDYCAAPLPAHKFSPTLDATNDNHKVGKLLNYTSYAFTLLGLATGLGFAGYFLYGVWNDSAEPLDEKIFATILGIVIMGGGGLFFGCVASVLLYCIVAGPEYIKKSMQSSQINQEIDSINHRNARFRISENRDHETEMIDLEAQVKTSTILNNNQEPNERTPLRTAFK